MMRFTVVFTFLFTLAFATQARAGLIVDPTFDVLHIADAAEFDAVGVLLGHRSDGSIAGIGTMFMYDHYNGKATYHSFLLESFDSYSIRLGSNSRNSYTSYDVSDIIFHPDFNGTGLGKDEVVLQFHDGIQGITPIPLYDGPHTIGDTYRLISGGRTGVIGGDTTVLDGNFRGGYNVLTNFSDDELYLKFRADAPGSANYANLEMFPSNMSSGSPLLTLSNIFDEHGNVIDTQWVAGAIATDAMLTDSYNTIYNNLFGALILDVDFSIANSYRPTDSTAVPEPASIFLTGTASLLGLGYRRFRKKPEDVL